MDADQVNVTSDSDKGIPMTRSTDAETIRLAQEMSGDLEPIDRGPLTQPAELTDEALVEFEVHRTPGKAEAWHQRNDAAAVEADLVEFRARGLL